MAAYYTPPMPKAPAWNGPRPVGISSGAPPRTPNGGIGLPTGVAATGATPPHPSAPGQVHPSSGFSGGAPVTGPRPGSGVKPAAPYRPGPGSSQPHGPGGRGGARPGAGRPATGPAKPPAPRPTDPLAALSPAQIQAQAQSTVTSSYAADFTGLDSEAQAARNLDAKRAADNVVYSNWLASTGAALVGANATMMDHLETANQAALATGSASIQSQATNGIIAGSAQSTLMSATAAADIAQLVAGTQRSNDLAGIASAETGKTALNSLAAQSQLRSQQSAATDATLNTIHTDRMKLTQAEGADIIKEVGRLQGVEINKAEFKANYTAAVGKINAGIGEHNQANKTRLAGIAAGQRIHAADRGARDKIARARLHSQEVIAGKRLRQASISAQQTADYRNWQRTIAGQKLTDAESKDLYLRTHHLGAYRPAKSGSGGGGAAGSALTPSQQRASYASIETFRGQLARIMQGRGPNGQPLTPDQAYHILAQGGVYYETSPHPTTVKGKTTYSPGPHAISVKAVGSTSLLNAAYNLQRPGGGYINSNDLAGLNRMGLYGVRQRYEVRASAPAFHNTAPSGGALH